MKKRTIEDFISRDVEAALESNKKQKLVDIFGRTGRAQITRQDEAEFNRIDWRNLIADTLGIYKERHKKKLEQSHMIPIWKQYTREFISSTKVGGDKRLADLNNCLNWFDSKYQRSTHQIEFHKAFMASCLRNIYQDEFSANFLRILQENELTEARQEVFICCPRRFGKTFAVGLFCAAYLLTQPEQKICVFSPSKRQSKMMLDLIAKFVKDYPGGSELISKQNAEELHLKGQAANDTRVLNSYPSRVQVCESARPLSSHPSNFRGVHNPSGPRHYTL